MTYYNHQAIRRAYPDVVLIDDSTGAFDADGNQVVLNQEIVDSAALEVATEQALSRLRRQRNQLLAETDWTQSRDVTLPNDSEWATYRQALRDLPANTEDPANPVWPTKPE